MRNHWLALSLLLSFSAVARVSIEEKENRVDFLQGIATVAPSVSIEAYQRELEYERQGLSLNDRARNEVGLLAESIKTQVVQAYESALERHGNPVDAEEEVRSVIIKDLQLAAPAFREELMNLSMEALRTAESGISSGHENLENLEKVMLENVRSRVAYLNEEIVAATPCPECEERNKTRKEDPRFLPTAYNGRDASKTRYENKAELLESLASDRESTRFVSTSNTNLTSSQMSTRAAKVSLQVKIEFLGVAVEAGPVIAFNRTFTSNVSIMADGMKPVLLPDGNFDFHQRDNMNRIVMKNGKPAERFIVFYCSNNLEFSTDYKGSGGFKVAGIGAEASVSQHYSNTVTINSRRISVPQYVGGRSVTLEFLSRVCHYDFLKTKVNDRLTIEGSLNVLMKNMVDSLRFSHPKTECAVDGDCFRWFNTEVLGLLRSFTYPRCGEEKREKFRACIVRALKGQPCPVIKNGKRVSSGFFEFRCDTGLKCVQTREAGWFRGWDIYQSAKGECRPINPRTYRDPRQRGYIEIHLAN